MKANPFFSINTILGVAKFLWKGNTTFLSTLSNNKWKDFLLCLCMYRMEQLLRRMKTILHPGGEMGCFPSPGQSFRVGNSVWELPQRVPPLTGSQLKEWLLTIVPAFPHKKMWQFKCLTEHGKDWNKYQKPRAPCHKSYINLSLPNPWDLSVPHQFYWDLLPAVSAW